MKNQKRVLAVLVLALSIMVSSCTTCKSSQYRRRYFSSIENKNTLQKSCLLKEKVLSLGINKSNN